jgi:hypothetical protein
MPHAMLQTSEDVISGILNWVCPECGGRMGGPTREFKCQGQCRKDWRAVWESRLAKPGKNTTLPRLWARRTRTMDEMGRRGYLSTSLPTKSIFVRTVELPELLKGLDSVKRRRGRFVHGKKHRP